MAANEIIVEFGTKGAGFVFDEIKKVERTVDQVRAKMKSPIGQEMDINAFGVKAMKEATGTLHALGIEYEKTRGKMKSPLVSPESLMSVQQFTKKGYSKDLKEFNKNLGETGEKAKDAGSHFGFFSRILAAMAIRSMAREVYEMANAFTALQNKIKTITQEDSVNFITKELFDIAQNTRTSLESVATAYARTSRSVSSLGKSQAEVLEFTENLSKAIQVGGSNAVEASNAMIQLSQGMGSGALRGDELRSVLEQLPIVAELIADKMGVPTSALRKLGAEGKLSTEVVFDAINAGAAKVDAMFQKMDVTVPQAWQRFKNQAVMAAEGAKGAMAMLAQMIEFVTAHFNLFSTAAGTAAVVIGMIFVTRGVNVAINALSGLLNSLQVATKAQAMLNAVTLANPYALAAAAVVTLSAGLIALTWDMKILGDGTVTFGDLWKSTWEVVSETFSSGDVTDGIKEVDASVVGLNKNIEGLMMTAAKAVDILTMLGPLALAKAGVAWATDSNMFSMVQDKVRQIIDRTNLNAENEETNRMIQEGKDLMAEDMSLDPGKIVQGEQSTFQSVMDKWNDRLDMLEEGGSRAAAIDKKFKKEVASLSATIRDTMSMDDFDLLRSKIAKEYDLTHKKSGRSGKIVGWDDIMKKASSGDEIAEIAQYSEQTARIEKKTRDLINSLDKSAFKGLSADDIREKTEAVRAIVAHEEYLIQLKKDEAFVEKEMNASIDEKLKLLKKEEELAAKAASDRFNSRNSLDVEMARELDPEFAVGIEIRKWQEFEKRMERFPELAEKARDKIKELQDSLALGGLAADYARDIEAIYGVGGSLSKGFSDTAAEILIMNRNLRETRQLFADLAGSIAQQALSRGIQLIIDTGITAIAGGFAGGGGNMPGLTVAGSGEATKLTMVPGTFSGASGGYTGNVGVNEVAGIVHGQEFVLNANATSSIGKDNLAYMNKTGKMPQMTEKSAPAPTVNVHNYAGVQVDTQVSRSEINVMINQAIKEKTPGLVATEVRNPNSRTSRSLQRNLEAERRRR